MFQKPGEWLMLRRPKNHTSRAVNDHSSDIKDNGDSDKIMRERGNYFSGWWPERVQTQPNRSHDEDCRKRFPGLVHLPPTKQTNPDQTWLACLYLLSLFLSHTLDHQWKRGFIFIYIVLDNFWRLCHLKKKYNDKNDQMSSSLSFFLSVLCFE